MCSSSRAPQAGSRCSAPPSKAQEIGGPGRSARGPGHVRAAAHGPECRVERLLCSCSSYMARRGEAAQGSRIVRQHAACVYGKFIGSRSSHGTCRAPQAAQRYRVDGALANVDAESDSNLCPSTSSYMPASFATAPPIPAMLSIMLFPLMIPVVAIKNLRPAQPTRALHLEREPHDPEGPKNPPLFCRETQRSAAISV